jgi:hypothetical protein
MPYTDELFGRAESDWNLDAGGAVSGVAGEMVTGLRGSSSLKGAHGNSAVVPAAGLGSRSADGVPARASEGGVSAVAGAAGASVAIAEWDINDESSEGRALSRVAWADMAAMHGFMSHVFLTLTFDEERVGLVESDRALRAWRYLVALLNLMMWGKGYKKHWKHSSFSYIAAVDFSRLGAVHLHVVIDGWVDYREIHAIWNKGFGFAWAERVGSEEDWRVALAHVVKYATKAESDVDFWFSHSPCRVDPSKALRL